MRKRFKSVPNFEHLLYEYNQAKGVFVVSKEDALKSPVNALTNELLPIQSFAPHIRENARTSIVSKRRKAGFITGIHKTHLGDWFVGNWFEITEGVKHTGTVIFHLPGCGIYFSDLYFRITEPLHVFFFASYDDYGMYDRINFANYAIPTLKKKIAETP